MDDSHAGKNGELVHMDLVSVYAVVRRVSTSVISKRKDNFEGPMKVKGGVHMNISTM